MSTNDPIQQLLVTARRNQILDAATAVFAEKGFHPATVKDIARAAGIGDGTIYNYFASKPEILLGIMDRLNETEQRGRQFTEGSAQDFRSFFVAYLRHRLAVLWPHRQMLQAVLPEILAHAELRQRYYDQMIAPSIAVAEAYFARQIQEGTLRPLEVSMLVRVLAGAIFGMLLMGLLGDEYVQAQVDRIPEALADMVLNGILETRP